MPSFLSNLHLSPPTHLLIGIIFWVLNLTSPLAIGIWLHKKRNLKEILTNKVHVNIWIFMLLITSSLYFLVLFIDAKNSISPVLSCNTEETGNNNGNSNQKVWVRLDDNLFKWDRSEIVTDKHGYYCPRGTRENYLYRSLWYRKSIPVVTDGIGIRFVVRKSEENDDNLSI